MQHFRYKTARFITGTLLATKPAGNMPHKKGHTVKTKDRTLYRHKPHTTNSKYHWDKPHTTAHNLAATLPRFTITDDEKLPNSTRTQRSISADIAAALLTLRRNEAFIINHTTASKPTIHNALATLKFAFPERHFVATNNEDQHDTTIVVCTEGPNKQEHEHYEAL